MNVLSSVSKVIVAFNSSVNIACIEHCSHFGVIASKVHSVSQWSSLRLSVHDQKSDAGFRKFGHWRYSLPSLVTSELFIILFLPDCT